MKTKTIILIFLALMISNSSCFKEKLSWSEQCLKTDYNPNVLPKETQTGANRLGCLIDGKVFANSKCSPYYSFGWSQKPIEAKMYKSFGINDEEMSSIYIGAYAHDKSYIGITIHLEKNPDIGDTIKIIGDYPTGNRISYLNENRFCDQEYGKICFTRLDTINKIISGRFEGKPCLIDEYREPINGKFLNITEGRFDIKYE